MSVGFVRFHRFDSDATYINLSILSMQLNSNAILCNASYELHCFGMLIVIAYIYSVLLQWWVIQVTKSQTFGNKFLYILIMISNSISISCFTIGMGPNC